MAVVWGGLGNGIDIEPTESWLLFKKRKGYASSGNTPSIDHGQETHNLPTISQKNKGSLPGKPSHPGKKYSINPHVEKQREQVPLTSVRGAELPPRSLLCPKHCLSSTSTTSNPKLTQGLAQARQQLVPQPIPAHKDTAMSLARSSSTKQ